MTTRILLQKGCLLKAQLQTHGLDVKLDSFDMRKVGEEWKLLIPNLVVDAGAAAVVVVVSLVVWF